MKQITKHILEEAFEAEDLYVVHPTESEQTVIVCIRGKHTYYTGFLPKGYTLKHVWTDSADDSVNYAFKQE